MEKETENVELKMEVIESFFKNEFQPREFLDNLHDVIVGLVEYAGQAGPCVDVKDVARHTGFLSAVYDTVRKTINQ